MWGFGGWGIANWVQTNQVFWCTCIALSCLCASSQPHVYPGAPQFRIMDTEPYPGAVQKLSTSSHITRLTRRTLKKTSLLKKDSFHKESKKNISDAKETFNKQVNIKEIGLSQKYTDSSKGQKDIFEICSTVRFIRPTGVQNTKIPLLNWHCETVV